MEGKDSGSGWRTPTFISALPKILLKSISRSSTLKEQWKWRVCDVGMESNQSLGYRKRNGVSLSHDGNTLNLCASQSKDSLGGILH